MSGGFCDSNEIDEADKKKHLESKVTKERVAGDLCLVEPKLITLVNAHILRGVGGSIRL